MSKVLLDRLFQKFKRGTLCVLLEGRRHYLEVEFNPEDLWVGLYWRKSQAGNYYFLDMWLCLLPCFPLHFIRSSYDERK